MTEVSAVPTCQRRAALGTGAYFRSHRRDHPTIVVSLDPKNPHAGPGAQSMFFRMLAYRRGTDQSKQHGK